jgi:hypothetical protein
MTSIKHLIALFLFATTTTLDELTAHIREAVEWSFANRDLTRANAIIICAWNEHVEGGWLKPPLGADGRLDEARIRAIGKVLNLN